MRFRATWPIEPVGLDMTLNDLRAEVGFSEMADLQWEAGAEITGPITWRIDPDGPQLIAEADARPWVDELARRRGVDHATATSCRVCQIPLYRRGTPHHERPDGSRQHQARGLCSTCYGRTPAKRAAAEHDITRQEDAA